MVEGVTVLRCKQCRAFRIEGDTEVIRKSSDPISALARRAHALGIIDIDQQVMNSDIDDPRWTQIYL
jgi:hypothetical protein